MEYINKKRANWLNAVLILGILIFINILVQKYYFTIDMTEEGRYTLTEPTINTLEEIEDVVFVKVLLNGELPAGFTRLQTGIREMLQDFRSHAPSIAFQFENPNEGEIEDVKLYRYNLGKQGIYPVNLLVKSGTEMKETLIYPYLIFHFGKREVVVNILENNPGLDQESNLNNSLSQLEYKMANAIVQVQKPRKNNIVFMTGHGELDKRQTTSLRSHLRKFYNTGRINLDSTYFINDEIDVILIARPTKPFSEKHKFIIDQYVMNGGKVIWMIDKLSASMDSLNQSPSFIALPRELGIDDLLFKYGVRVQPNVVLDMECTRIPQVIGQTGGKPQIELFPWFYHVLATPTDQHPISKGLDRVNLFFPSSIDTIKTKTKIKKTILLTSSKYSRFANSPATIGFDILRYKPKVEKFNRPNLPLAVMLEGEFSSLYEGRVSDEIKTGMKQLDKVFIKKSPINKMMIVGDGDFIKNIYNKRNEKPSDIGFNKYEKFVFTGNKDFIINAIDYMIEDKKILESRSKVVKLRLLDKVRAKSEKTKWQLINVLLPLLLLTLFGIGYNFIRKRRYANSKYHLKTNT